MEQKVVLRNAAGERKPQSRATAWCWNLAVNIRAHSKAANALSGRLRLQGASKVCTYDYWKQLMEL